MCDNNTHLRSPKSTRIQALFETAMGISETLRGNIGIPCFLSALKAAVAGGKGEPRMDFETRQVLGESAMQTLRPQKGFNVRMRTSQMFLEIRISQAQPSNFSGHGYPCFSMYMMYVGLLFKGSVPGGACRMTDIAIPMGLGAIPSRWQLRMASKRNNAQTRQWAVARLAHTQTGSTLLLRQWKSP